MTRQLLVRAIVVLAAAVGLAPTGVEAQEFIPQDAEEQATSGNGGLNLGLYGFSMRMGLDIEGGGDAQPLLSLALDMGDVFTRRLRLRPSAEIGFGNAVDTYVVNAEVMFRLADDTEAAVPYIGGGFAVAGQDNCGLAPNCPEVWLQFALGFEIRIREFLNWLLEYHAEDGLQRHRLFIGLSTRRAP
ncbi:MAG: hypothetical protein IH876_03310 [Gemmatimonadetes bacterium]|nr:hypothetical protein [Gemmatimonadota bacterium]MCH7715136.1 hypothetical protein [Gemmatimonadota bacterium]